MRNLFTKFKYSIQADLHDMFDKKVDKNPIKMLNHYIREAEKQTEETGKLLARQAQLKKSWKSNFHKQSKCWKSVKISFYWPSQLKRRN